MADLRIQLVPTTGAASQARTAVGGWLKEEHAGDGAAADVLMVVSELVTNSIRHARPSNGNALWLSAERDGDGIRLAVHDGGTDGRVELRPPERTGDRIGGYGLQLVATLATAWGVLRDGDGTLVWVRLPL